jgi:hypothetical protein
VRATGPGAALVGPCRLEPGVLGVSLVVEGFPVGDLPPGSRLRVGATVVVELEPPAGDAPTGEGGVLEPGDATARPAAVLQGGAVEPGDTVELEAVRLPLTDVLDLHSFRPGDVPHVVREYLEAARRAGLVEVRIVHGRGRGVQRAVVRRLLAGLQGVAGFADAPPVRGGWGATLVRLHRAEDAPSG